MFVWCCLLLHARSVLLCVACWCVLVVRCVLLLDVFVVVVCYVLCVAWRCLCVVCCLLVVVVCCSSIIASSVLRVVCCSLFAMGVRRWLLVVVFVAFVSRFWCFLFVVCCLLFVV